MDNYISLQKNQLLDSLENQVRFSQLVAVLVGEKGIGKSFTLDCLQNRLEEEVSLAHIDASIEIQEEQLQKVICIIITPIGLMTRKTTLHFCQKKTTLTKVSLII